MDSHVIPLGESAFLIRLSDVLDLETNHRATSLAGAIRACHIDGVTDIVPANSSVGVYFDRAIVSADQIEKLLLASLDTGTSRAPRAEPRLHEIPAKYDGPDLEEVARRCAVSVSEVVEFHSASVYNVYAIGFAPGFAYMGELDPRISVPRRAQPRIRVPSGSVAIANRQTAIYPFQTPGGWNLIASTTVPVFDAEREPASLFRVGDKVRFVAE